MNKQTRCTEDLPCFLNINIDHIALSDTIDIPMELKKEMCPLPKESLGKSSGKPNNEYDDVISCFKGKMYKIET